MINRKKNNIIAKSLAFLMIIMAGMSYLPSNINPMVTSADAITTISTDDYLALEAVKSNYNSFMSGTAVDADPWSGSFNSYDAYILIQAGFDISSWEYNDVSFSDSVIALMDATIDKEGTSSQSSAKRVAQDYLAAIGLGDTEQASSLIGILNSRQTASGEFDSGTYSIYSNLAAYDLISRESSLADLGFDVDSIVNYILDNQDPSSNAWPTEDADNWIENDFMSTSQAVRVLEILKDDSTVDTSTIEDTITHALLWLQDKQKEDGSYDLGSDDVVTDVSEMIYTAKILGEDPSTWVNTLGKSPVNYMTDSAFIDGSFGNIASTTWALDAYLQLGAKISNINDLAFEAIKENYETYISGTAVDGGGYATFSSYDAYILMKAGVDISNWKYDGKSFSDRIIALIDATISNEGIDGKSSAKRVAQDYLAAKSLGETEKANKLLDILIKRQTESGEFDSGEYIVYTNLAAYDLLAREGALLDSGINLDRAVMYVLNNQDSTNAWPSGWTDFMATTQAVRILKVSEGSTAVTSSAIKAAITGGTTWLQDKQKEDGSYDSGSDDVVTDVSEMIYTAKILGEDPSTWVNTLGKSPVDYMIDSAFIDGSFGNIASTTWALDAYLQLNTMVLADSESDNGSSTSNTEDSSFKVKVAVIGKDDEIIYGPKSVSLYSDDTYGYTAMGALDATGLSWKFGSTDGFVDEIDGEKNQGMNGWMYSINGKSPSKLATNATVNSGSKVLWWYSTSAMEGAPDWPSSTSSSSTVTSSSTDAVKGMLENYSTKIIDKNVILNSEKRMTALEAEKINSELKANKVSLSSKYTGEEIAMTDGEVSVLLPADALDDTATITVNELESTDNPRQYAIKLNSSVYEFGPTGTNFNETIILSIKIAIDENTDLDNLCAAWFDEENNKWIPISSVIDVETGMITFKTDHFTKYAIIEIENRINFDDVDDSMSWAKDAIEILAGQGIINGTGTSFQPQRSITRAEFIKIIVKALNYEVNDSTKINFNDVNDSEWFADYIECAYDKNIIAGDPDGNFRPNDVISRNEISVILSRLQEEQESYNSYDLTFDDASSVPQWAMNGVKFAVKEKLMNGYDNNVFMGLNPMTRAEAATVTYRYLNSFLNK
ncbi:MAG: S-layer homology domain-containing protein [Sedimentibacter sp.]